MTRRQGSEITWEPIEPRQGGFSEPWLRVYARDKQRWGQALLSAPARTHLGHPIWLTLAICRDDQLLRITPWTEEDGKPWRMDRTGRMNIRGVLREFDITSLDQHRTLSADLMPDGSVVVKMNEELEAAT